MKAIREKTAGKLWAALCLATVFGGGGSAHAETDADSDPAFLILGAAKNPEYFGSADHDLVPFAVSQFDYGGGDFEIEGLTVYALRKSTSRWRQGLSVEIDTGRNDEVTSPVIGLMKPIDAAVNFGGLLGYSRPNLVLSDDEFEMKLAAYTDINDAHDGFYSTLTLTYALPLMIPWRFELEAETTFGDGNYMNTYFGVDSSDAARTGMDSFAPGASFRDVALTANIILFFNPRFGIFTRLSFARLFDSAKDSPVVLEGDDQQYFIGVGAFIRLGE